MASTYYNPSRQNSFDIDGQPVPQFVRDFLHHEIAVSHLSPFSIRNYCLTLSTFLKWYLPKITDVGTNIQDLSFDVLQHISSSDISDFLEYCRIERKNSTSARASKLSALSTFFEYCVHDAGVLDHNPASDVSAPKKITKPVKYMTGREALSLIKACNCGETPARDVCIATFMLNCGLRLSELVALNLSDIDGNNMKIWGNGRNDRTVILNDDCITALNFWMQERSIYSLENTALFISRRYSARITERAVQQMLDKAFERAGLKERGYTARTLRFTAGKLMYQSGNFDIPDLQLLLGHKSTAFATGYLSTDGEQALAAMAEFKIK